MFALFAVTAITKFSSDGLILQKFAAKTAAKNAERASTN
jgi:hypothetical protein